MRILLMLCFMTWSVTASAGQIASGPINQIVVTNDQSGAWKKDPWEPNKKLNAIDPKTGLKTGGFVKRDIWEPKTRWNVYDQKGNYKGMVRLDAYESDRWNYTPSESGIGSYDDGVGAYNDGITGSIPSD